MRELLVKICGITNSGDALAAASFGADLIGLIFAPASKRCVERKQASAIATACSGADAPRPRMVGVFVDADIDEILQTITEVGLNLVQLHGNESAETIRKLRLALAAVAPEVQLIKALSAPASDDLNSYDHVDYFLFDRPKNEPQPTSNASFPRGACAAPTFCIGDSAANGIGDSVRIINGHSPKPYFVAGGITPVNISTVCGACMDDPMFSGIDVASGVEKSPGIKDHTKMRELISRAKEAAAHAITR